MELYVIAGLQSLPEESRLINKLFEAGLEVFHLRKPGMGRKEYAALIAGIDVVWYDRIALHQHHELAAEFGVRRLHYPEQMRSELHTRAYPEGTIRSTSVHDPDVLNVLHGFNYTFFGPVFDSLSKPGHKARYKPAQLTAALNGCRQKPGNTKVIAVGGIGLYNALHIAEMGFDGLALLGAVWSKPEQAVENYRMIRNLVWNDAATDYR